MQEMQNDSDTKISLLYASMSVEDILLKDLVDELANKYRDRLDVKYFVTDVHLDS